MKKYLGDIVRKYLDGFKEALKSEKKKPKAQRRRLNAVVNDEENFDRGNFTLDRSASPHSINLCRSMPGH